MKEYTLKIPSMHDEISSKGILSILYGIKGIEDADINYEDGIVHVYFNDEVVTSNAIINSIEKLGYDAYEC